MKDLLDQIEDWLSDGRQLSLATVIRTWGSSPRPIGAGMAVTLDGKVAGSVSGGCVEGAVIESAFEVLRSGKPARLHFGVADDEAWEVGLACGGEIEVYIREFEEADLEIWKLALNAGKAFCSGLVLDGGKDYLGQDIILLEDGSWLGPDLPSEVHAVMIKAGQENFQGGSSGIIEFNLDQDWEVFLHLIEPDPTLIIIGGVHIAIPLTRMAEVMGFDVIVIDPRRLFGSQERFPGVKKLLTEWPEPAFKKIEVDSSTAVVMLTHDPKIDDPAIKIALKTPAFYIGALGSKRTHQKRIERLIKDGIEPEGLDRLHAPIGLDIGGGSPQEIALSIISEIVKVWNSIP
jgi:xanthine dehydrogenase accessory factor